MNLKRYLIPLHEAETGGVEPPVVDVVPPVVVAETVIEPPVPEPVIEPEPEHGNKGKKPWFLERISQESHRAQTAEERAAAAERRAADAEAVAQRLQSGSENPAPRLPATPSDVDIDRLVDQRADAKRFAEDTIFVKNAGLQKFGAGFDNTLNILTAIGATNNDVVADILAVDKANAHVLLDKLAQDPEKAAALVSMNSRTRIAELTRMTMADVIPIKDPAKPAPKQVSRAPAPPPPVEPSASKIVDWRTDEASDEDFDKGFKEMVARRNARR